MGTLCEPRLRSDVVSEDLIITNRIILWATGHGVHQDAQNKGLALEIAVRAKSGRILFVFASYWAPSWDILGWFWALGPGPWTLGRFGKF